MNVLYIIYFFLMGLVLGSFYNVVGYRLPSNQSIVKPRSHCTQCNHTLSFLELIPVFSYIFLAGKCSKCKQKISIFYPLIELLTGILFAYSFYRYGFSYKLFLSLILSSLLSIVLVSDINFYIIPDSVIVISSILIIIIKLIYLPIIDVLMSLCSGVILFFIMYLIMRLGNFIFKKETLGGADIKLMFIVGLILHPVVGAFNIFLASCLALPISIIIYYKKKEKAIPFGPFLVIGLLILFTFNISFDTLKLIFSL